MIDNTDGPVGTTTIKGMLFHYAKFSERAMGRFDAEKIYRALYRGGCFELHADIASTDFDMYDSGTIRRFRSANLWKELDAIVKTFRFVGPVACGRAWQGLQEQSKLSAALDRQAATAAGYAWDLPRARRWA